MRDATEAEVVWQYIRWHAEYRDSTRLPIITDPNLNDDKENDARWRILARNEGHVLRVRYPFDGPPRPYQWSFRPAPQDLFAAVFSSYQTESGLLTINEIATDYFHHGRRRSRELGRCRRGCGTPSSSQTGNSCACRGRPIRRPRLAASTCAAAWFKVPPRE